MRHQRAGIGVKIRAPARRAVLVFLRRLRIRIEAVHLGGQPPELGERDVAGAAFCRCLLAGGGIGRAERLRAFGGKLRHRQDVGRGVQVALRMAADQFAVFGKGDVAFDDAGTHASGGYIRLFGMFGEFQRGAAMADGKVGLAKRPGALAELLLQRPVLHLVDQIKRPRPDLRLAGQGNVLRRGWQDGGQDPERGEHGGAMAGGHRWHLG